MSHLSTQLEHQLCFPPQVEKSLQRIQSGQCNPMYTSQQSVENKVSWLPLCLSINKVPPLSALTAACVFSRWAGFPAGRPSSLPLVSAWTSPEAPLVSLRRCSSPPQTRGTGCSSAAPRSSPCSVPQPHHTCRRLGNYFVFSKSLIIVMIIMDWIDIALFKAAEPLYIEPIIHSYWWW